MAASTDGSSILLLTLCFGALWVCASNIHVNLAEMLVLLGSTAALAISVWMGKMARIMGISMPGGYIAFVVLEFKVIRKCDVTRLSSSDHIMQHLGLVSTQTTGARCRLGKPISSVHSHSQEV